MRNLKLLLIFILGLLAGNNLYSVVYYSKSTGALDAPSTWGINTDGTGAGPGTNFFGSHEFIICNRTSVNTGSGVYWQISPTGTITIGDGVNPINVTFGSNDVIEDAIVNVSNSATLTLTSQVSNIFVIVNNTTNCGLNILNSNSTVVYSVAAAVIAIPWSVPPIYGSLVLSDNSSLSGSLQTGSLSIASGKLLNVTNASQLTITDNLMGSGSLSAASGTVFFNLGNKGGSRGTFFSTGSINTVRFNCTAGTYVTLGNDLTISGSGGAFVNNTASGMFDLNGKRLTLSNDITFPSNSSAGFLGSTSSDLVINGSGVITNANLSFKSTGANLRSLVFNRTGNSITVGPNNLTIHDSISVFAGTLNTGNLLTLESSTSLSARVGLIGGTLAGDITKKTIVPGTSSGWANLGTPGITNQSIGNWDTWVSSGQTTGLPMTCQGCTYDVTGTGAYFESIQAWTESTQSYDSTLTNASSLTPGKGFWVYVGSGLNSTTDLTLENTGAAVTGPTTIPISKSSVNGYNLIANPYPSPISWSKVMALTGNSSLVQNAVYIWNADLASGAGATTSYVGGVASPGGITSANDVIPAGQGFYVTALSAGNLAFNESVKVASNTSANPLLRSAKANVGQVFRVKLEGTDQDWDAAVFRIHPMATPAFDAAWDAHKLFSSPGYAGYPGAYSKYTTVSSKDAEGNDYAIHSFPEPATDLTLPLLVRVKQTGTYTLTGLELENIPSCLILKDKLLNKTQDLQMGDYVFNISDTTASPRFELQLCRGASAVTGIQETKLDARSVQIFRNEFGVQVNTQFSNNTLAKIEVFNLLAQALCEKVEVAGTENEISIPLDPANNLVLVKVTTATESYSKKVLLR